MSGVGPMIGKGVGVGSTGPAGETCPPSSVFTSLIGMANPIPEMGLPEPSVSTRETTTPITCPNMFSSGPPLFPGFNDASVCRRVVPLCRDYAHADRRLRSQAPKSLVGTQWR